ncbi:CST complex subunit CTC1-like isoform X2 [Gigantopelta aegis]|uniref:CST complex subunit CTC1-like isoform X2 n=1 Tax=Gigantopelta aegis TaxID=1735272 RepID=UPI001B88C8BC|nr:CST complex subunit CTC1-like isoform X2 [Gigantopelta aegis]
MCCCRDHLPRGSLVNICGLVSAVSEVFRVKKDHLFLIQLENVFIVIKQHKFLAWQEQITPKKEFVFSNLCPTTLHKGISVPTRVFVPWTNSEMHAADKVNIFTIRIQKWLEEKTVTDIEHGNDSLSTMTKENTTKLVSYQGVVTGTASAKYGIYELDGKIILHVSALPARHKFVFLKIGTRIVVYNTHREEFREEPRIHLHCCVMSCIKVEENCSNPQSSHIKVDTFSPSNQVVKLITNFGLNGRDISSLLDMVKRIKVIAKGPTHAEEIVSHILSSVCSWLKHHPRNFVGEFLTIPHCCHLLVGELSGRRIPMLAEIKGLHESTDSLDQDLSTLKKKYSSHDMPASELNQQLYWSYLPRVITKSPQQILVGRFEFSSVSGRLVLRDDTGSINVIVVCSAATAEHTCDHHCLEVSQGKPITCPKVQPALSHCLVGVSKCEVVTERFLNTDMADCRQIDRAHVLQSRYVTYLQISLTDCVFLDTRDEWPPESCEPSTKLMRLPPTEGVPGSRPSVSERATQLLYVTHVESLMVKTFTTSRALVFCALGYFVGDSTEMGHEPAEISDSDVAYRMSGARSKTSVGVVGDRKAEDDADSSPVDSGCSVIPVVVVFHGRSVRWYECLQMGSFYRLISKGTKPLFKLKAFYGTKLKAAVEFSHARMCYQVDDDISVEKVLSSTVKGLSEDIKQRLEPAPLDTVEEILSESFSGTVVSFSGQIVTRKHLDQNVATSEKIQIHSYDSEELETRNKTLGISILKRRTVCLEVGAFQRQSVQVYMNLDNISYPLGLLPGATVLFTRLERRVSSSGTVYCQYTTVSTVSVCQVSNPNTSSVSDSTWGTAHRGEVLQVNSQLGVQYLSQLYNGTPTSVGSFQVLCHVCTFMKLSLRVACAACGSRFTSTGCSSAHCSSVESTFSAKASVLVDDGSAPAIVSFYKSDLVRRVLCLSHEQWHDLQDLIQQREEVFIHQFIGRSGVTSSVESFLMLLCDSAHVKRRLQMCVRPAWTIARARPAVLNMNNFTTDELLYKKITTGLDTFETRCHPYLQLECLDLQEENFDPVIFQKLTS